MLEGRFTTLKEDPALYPHTCLGPMIYMGTVVTKWATQRLAWGSTLHTVGTIKQFVDVLNRQVLAAERPYKKHKHTLVSLSQLANLKNIFKTRYQVTLE